MFKHFSQFLNLPSTFFSPFLPHLTGARLTDWGWELARSGLLLSRPGCLQSCRGPWWAMPQGGIHRPSHQCSGFLKADVILGAYRELQSCRKLDQVSVPVHPAWFWLCESERQSLFLSLFPLLSEMGVVLDQGFLSCGVWTQGSRNSLKYVEKFVFLNMISWKYVHRFHGLSKDLSPKY